MIRPILTELALFALPFALYALFLLVTRAGVFDPAQWSWRVIGWLTIAALFCVVLSFFILAQFSGEPRGSTYVPAHIGKDGQIVPGRTR